MEIVLLQLQEDPPPPAKIQPFPPPRVSTRREGCGRGRRIGCVGGREEEDEEKEEEERVHLWEMRKWIHGMHYVTVFKRVGTQAIFRGQIITGVISSSLLKSGHLTVVGARPNCLCSLTLTR